MAQCPVIPDKDSIIGLLPDFTGSLMQRPPQYSAIKIAGRRAYALARRNQPVVLPLRQVRIDAFTLLQHLPPLSDFSVSCEKGVYIRALARDCALRLGTFAHIVRLRRTRVGRLTQCQLVTLDSLRDLKPEERIALVRPVPVLLDDIPEVTVTQGQAEELRQGRSVTVGADHLSRSYATFHGKVIAFGKVSDSLFYPSRVLAY
jgi:tRNA pseudouridine55 synthase